MNKLDLVIFDMDGLLLDTETISLAAWKKLLKIIILILTLKNSF
ncbi:HAD hydrolase-like protein [Brachyspira hyodysenteriae]|nr:HAD hydrolase-like protein [Brachyspira hyodysenteriae]MDA1469778.1 HAD hydrolase-like protein [Brachyspira hyodysenteriae]